MTCCKRQQKRTVKYLDVYLYNILKFSLFQADFVYFSVDGHVNFSTYNSKKMANKY